MRPGQQERDVPLQITLGDFELGADLSVPPTATGLIVFAHGSGSSRHSPRNRFVASILNQGGLATILLDLLTDQEEIDDRRSSALRFDIALLADRLGKVTDWISKQQQFACLPVGYFGASTGAGAALVAAAERQTEISAIVSRGGRPDLAEGALAKVYTPTLFIVGSNDQTVLDLNRQALAKMPMPDQSRLEVVPGATHLFEEPGALEAVADLAHKWFRQYVVRS